MIFFWRLQKRSIRHLVIFASFSSLEKKKVVSMPRQSFWLQFTRLSLFDAHSIGKVHGVHFKESWGHFALYFWVSSPLVLDFSDLLLENSVLSLLLTGCQDTCRRQRLGFLFLQPHILQGLLQEGMWTQELPATLFLFLPAAHHNSQNRKSKNKCYKARLSEGMRSLYC